MRRDPIMFFREVLRSGDESFVRLLVRILRRDPELRERADRELHSQPRAALGPPVECARLRELSESLRLNGNSA